MKGCGRECRSAGREAGLAAGEGEKGVNGFCYRPLSAHASVPLGVVQFPPADRTQRVEDLILAVRVVHLQPVREKIAHAVRQPYDGVAGETSTSLGRSGDDGWDFVVGEPWDNRRDHYPHRNSGLGQGMDRLQASHRG